jgi:hypothetical protein
MTFGSNTMTQLPLYFPTTLGYNPPPQTTGELQSVTVHAPGAVVG